MTIRTLLKSISALLGLLLIAYTLLSLQRGWQGLTRLSLEAPGLLLLNIPLLLLSLFASGKLLDTLLRPHGVRLTTLETLGMSTVARFGNYLSFGNVGFALRIYYLKKVRRVEFSQSLLGLAVGNLVFYIVCVCAALLALALLPAAAATKTTPLTLASWALALLLAMLLLPMLLKPLIPERGRLAALHRLISPLGSIFRQPLLLRLVFWAMLLLFSFTAMLAVEFAVLGARTSLPELLYMGSVSSLSGLFQITPAGLGVQEGLLLFSGNSVDVDNELLIASAILRRVLVFSCLALATPPACRYLFGASLSSLRREIRAGSDND